MDKAAEELLRENSSRIPDIMRVLSVSNLCPATEKDCDVQPKKARAKLVAWFDSPGEDAGAP